MGESDRGRRGQDRRAGRGGEKVRTRRLTRERESGCLGRRTAAKRDSAGLAGGAASSRTRLGEGADKRSLRWRGHGDMGVGNRGGRRGRSGDRESPGRVRIVNLGRDLEIPILILRKRCCHSIGSWN